MKNTELNYKQLYFDLLKKHLNLLTEFEKRLQMLEKMNDRILYFTPQKKKYGSPR